MPLLAVQMLPFPWKAGTDFVIHLLVHSQHQVLHRGLSQSLSDPVCSQGSFDVLVSCWIQPGCRCSMLFAEAVLAVAVALGRVAVPGGQSAHPRACWTQESALV